MDKHHCPITGVNIPRFLATTLAGFVFIFGYDFALHGNLLMGIYEQTSDLWRDPEEMKTFFPYMLSTQFFTALLAAFIFTRNYEGKGIGEGLRFGIMLGLLFGVMMSASYAWMPIPTALAGAWFAGGLGMGIGLGVIFSLIYRK